MAITDAVAQKAATKLADLIQGKIDRAKQKLTDPTIKLDTEELVAYILLKHNIPDVEIRSAVFEVMMSCVSDSLKVPPTSPHW